MNLSLIKKSCEELINQRDYVGVVVKAGQESGHAGIEASWCS